MIVFVEKVSVPGMSTIGYGKGKTEDGRSVSFAGDHRMMRDLGEALEEAGEPIEAEVESWQVIG